MNDRFSATYLIETAYPIEAVAAELCGEQSTSTSRRVPLETDELISAHGARIEMIRELEEVPTPSLPVPDRNDRYRRAHIVVSWPLVNIGTSLPMLLTTLLGNQTGMRRLSGIRLLDISLPETFTGKMPRPAFGVSGTRRLAGVEGRPLIGSVIKPNIGLTPEQTASVVDTLCSAGVDLIKDDELIGDTPYSPLEKRVAAVMPVIHRHADRTGRQAMYAFNITGDSDEMRRNHDIVAAAGGSCVMVNLVSTGLGAVAGLRRHSRLPIHGHRAGWAALTRSPALGLDFAPFQALYRLAGVDQIHVSGLGGKFWESAESVVASARACLTPFGEGGADDRAMPVVSGGSTVRHVHPTYASIGTLDMIFVAGAGILTHPGGPAEGVESLRAAWECARKGKPLEAQAAPGSALARALEHWPA